MLYRCVILPAACALLMLGCGWDDTGAVDDGDTDTLTCIATTVAFTSEPPSATVYMNDEAIGAADSTALTVCEGTQQMRFQTAECDTTFWMNFSTTNATVHVEVCPDTSVTTTP